MRIGFCLRFLEIWIGSLLFTNSVDLEATQKSEKTGLPLLSKLTDSFLKNSLLLETVGQYQALSLLIL